MVCHLCVLPCPSRAAAPVSFFIRGHNDLPAKVNCPLLHHTTGELDGGMKILLDLEEKIPPIYKSWVRWVQRATAPLGLVENSCFRA